MRFLILLLPALLAGQTYDIVVQHGRVLDPESGLDAVRNIGINGKKIAAISAGSLRGKAEVDATGLAVAPGFIDLHSHGQTPENYRYKAMDGVTTALEFGNWCLPGRRMVHGAGRKGPHQFWRQCGTYSSSDGSDERHRELPAAGRRNESPGYCGRTEGNRCRDSKGIE